MSTTTDVIAAFQPCPTGMEAHYVTANGEHFTRPVLGWLTVDECDTDSNGDALANPDVRPYRRIVAGVLSEAEIEAADNDSTFWHITYPGEPGPTTEEIAAQAAKTRDWIERPRGAA
ncbi:hypothetical protein [Dactylosporangium sp. CA-139066]|uniref:hypothetical protein n=1 Tax=Dactylosporangium sp. CA-139066 TaxID=3239930 RepID=UPI003D8B021B